MFTINSFSADTQLIAISFTILQNTEAITAAYWDTLKKIESWHEIGGVILRIIKKSTILKSPSEGEQQQWTDTF